MAFGIDNFAPVGNTSKRLTGVGTSTLLGAPSIFSYATADAINTVTAVSYFDSVATLLSVGDLIIVLAGAGSGGTPAMRLLYVNAKSAAGVVDVTDGTVVTATDTY